MMKYKQLIIGFILGSMFFSGISFASAEVKQAIIANDINFVANGQEKNVTFVNIDGFNYAKVRDIISAFNGTITYDASTKTIKVTIGSEVTNVSDGTTTTATNTLIDSSGLTYIEQDGVKYVSFVDVIRFCSKQGFSFGFSKLQNADGTFNNQIPYILSLDDVKKHANLEGVVDVYRINKITHFKYDFVVNILIPFMESNK